MLLSKTLNSLECYDSMNVLKNGIPREDKQAIVGVLKFLMVIALVLTVLRYWYFNF